MFKPDSVLVTVNPEICIKSFYVRKYFEKKLLENIKKKLKNEKIPFNSILFFYSRLLIETTHPKEVFSSLIKCFGIDSLALSKKIIYQNLNDFNEKACEIFEPRQSTGFFCVRAKSYSKNFSSKDVEVSLGSKILCENDLLRVDLCNPNKKINCILGEDFGVVFFESIKASSGLPVASQGRVALLCKKTIEDEKLGWLLLKKGCSLLLVGRKEIPSLIEWVSYYNIPSKSLSEAKKLYCEGVVRGFFTPETKLSEIKRIESKLGIKVFAPFLLSEAKTPFD